MDGLYCLAHHGRVSREDFSLIYRQISQGGIVGGQEKLREILSIRFGPGAALDLGLLGIRPPVLISKQNGPVNLD